MTDFSRAPVATEVPSRDRVCPFGVVTLPCGGTTGLGYVVTECARQRKQCARTVHTTDPTTVHSVVHCFGHCSWALFMKTV